MLCILVSAPAVEISRRLALGRAAAAAAAAGAPAAASAKAGDPLPIPGLDGKPLFGTGGVIDAFLPSDDLASRYAQNPADVSGVVLPSALVGVKDAAIIFHGAGGPDRETRAMEARFAEQDAAAGLARGVATFNWLPWFTTDTQRTSFISKDVGRALGQQLAANDGLRSLHVVGTSAGSFAASECCAGYVAARGGRARVTVRLSLADPFSAALEASPNDGRGAQFFGRDADFAEHLLNRDDIVPNTNTPLPFCYCLDVTKTAERKTFPPPDPTGDAFDDGRDADAASTSSLWAAKATAAPATATTPITVPGSMSTAPSGRIWLRTGLGRVYEDALKAPSKPSLTCNIFQRHPAPGPGYNTRSGAGSHKDFT